MRFNPLTIAEAENWGAEFVCSYMDWTFNIYNFLHIGLITEQSPPKGLILAASRAYPALKFYLLFN